MVFDALVNVPIFRELIELAIKEATEAVERKKKM